MRFVQGRHQITRRREAMMQLRLRANYATARTHQGIAWAHGVNYFWSQMIPQTKCSNLGCFVVKLTRPLGAGTFVRCSSESPLSLADGVRNVLKEVSQGATKIPSRTRVVLLRKRKRKSVFDWGWLQLSLFESSSQVESS
ncbi:hypothetical protein PIB30_041422 [Stylosanthes scabra]|uniref:Uncharacterized protein n=1 Tax=Stylosanthes scabra TaxID=79078 RepID=A0ABU6VDQ4_9FABA|nr:hypothetical protein [Stylosanthes scabra]